jgi:hypothetical protein
MSGSNACDPFGETLMICREGMVLSDEEPVAVAGAAGTIDWLSTCGVAEQAGIKRRKSRDLARAVMPKPTITMPDADFQMFKGNMFSIRRTRVRRSV